MYLPLRNEEEVRAGVVDGDSLLAPAWDMPATTPPLRKPLYFAAAEPSVGVVRPITVRRTP